MIQSLIRRYGLTERCRSARVVDIPVLSLEEPDVLLSRLAKQTSEAVALQEADAIELGCTGMIGFAAALQKQLESDGVYVPVIDPTGAAVLWLVSQVRLGFGLAGPRTDLVRAEGVMGRRGVDHATRLDAGAACANLALMAQTLGLGICTITSWTEPAVQALLDLPSHIRPDVTVAVGSLTSTW